MSILTSRAFQSSLQRHRIVKGPPPSSSQPSAAAPPKSILSTYDPDVILYPTLDLLNHSASTKNYWVTDAHSFSIICDDDLAPGDEIFNCYGAKNNGQLLLGYGFALPANPHDAFPLKIPTSEYPLLDKLGQLHNTVEMPLERREPSRIPDPHDPTATTFYVRHPERTAAIPGYPPMAANRQFIDESIVEALSGLSMALIVRILFQLLNKK